MDAVLVQLIEQNDRLVYAAEKLKADIASGRMISKEELVAFTEAAQQVAAASAEFGRVLRASK